MHAWGDRLTTKRRCEHASKQRSKYEHCHKYSYECMGNKMTCHNQRQMHTHTNTQACTATGAVAHAHTHIDEGASDTHVYTRTTKQQRMFAQSRTVCCARSAQRPAGRRSGPVNCVRCPADYKDQCLRHFGDKQTSTRKTKKPGMPLASPLQKTQPSSRRNLA